MVKIKPVIAGEKKAYVNTFLLENHFSFDILVVGGLRTMRFRFAK